MCRLRREEPASRDEEGQVEDWRVEKAVMGAQSPTQTNIQNKNRSQLRRRSAPL